MFKFLLQNLAVMAILGSVIVVDKLSDGGVDAEWDEEEE